MQDRDQLPQNFMEQAWADMHDRLDVAMPVTDRRRRLLPIWWVVGAAAAILLLFFLPFGQYDSTSGPMSTAADNRTSVPPAATPAEPATITQSAATDTKHVATAETNQSAKENTAVNPTSPLVLTDIAVNKSAKTNLPEPSTPSNNNAFTSTNPPTVTPESAGAATDIAVKTTDSPDTATPTAPRRVWMVEQQLPTLDADLLTSTSTLDEELTETVSAQLPRSVAIPAQPLRVYSEAMLLANEMETPSGFGGGLGVQKTLNNRLSIESGLRYRFNRWGLSDSSGLAVNNLTRSISADAYTFDVDPGEASATLTNIVVKEHALAIPLNLSYRLTNRLHAVGGIVVSYNLANFVGLSNDQEAALVISEDTSSGSGGLSANYSIANNSQWYNSNAANRLNQATSNRFRADASLGFRWRIATRWAVRLDARYDLMSPVESDVVSLNRGYVQTGVRYYW